MDMPSVHRTTRAQQTVANKVRLDAEPPPESGDAETEGMNPAPPTVELVQDDREQNERKGPNTHVVRDTTRTERMDMLHLQDWPATWPVEEAQGDLGQGTHATMPRWPAVAREQGVLCQIVLTRDLNCQKEQHPENGRAQTSS